MEKMVTVAERWDGNKLLRRYILKHDDKGFYFDGMHCASFRRKTRKAIERWANHFHFDVYETEVQ